MNGDNRDVIAAVDAFDAELKRYHEPLMDSAQPVVDAYAATTAGLRKLAETLHERDSRRYRLTDGGRVTSADGRLLSGLAALCRDGSLPATFTYAEALAELRQPRHDVRGMRFSWPEFAELLDQGRIAEV
jgi:hypothetical protein